MKKIILISGDPNSINSEIIYKTWKQLNKSLKKNIYLISNISLLKEQFKILKYKINLKKVEDIHENYDNEDLKIINLDLKFKNPFNVSNNAASNFVLKCLNLGHELALKKNVAGIINCPINKQLLKKRNIGVTEILASKCKLNDSSEAMLIRNVNLSVSPITTHHFIKNISNKIKKQLIVNKIKTINLFFKKIFIKKPKIAVLGLNPHNAELSKNSEEKKIIIPALDYLKKLKINVKGPLVADTIFINEYKKFDVIVGMYHDQVLAPFKALYKFNAINITLGLKYLRVSPDHGVGLDIIRQKKANSSSLLQCIKFINKYGK